MFEVIRNSINYQSKTVSFSVLSNNSSYINKVCSFSFKSSSLMKKNRPVTGQLYPRGDK